MESLLIKIPPQIDHAAEWVVIDHSGHPHATVRSGPLDAAEPHSHQRQVTALVPTTDLVINEVSFPNKNRRKFRQAVPYILEDQFADDVETLHFAIGHFKQAEDSEDIELKIPVVAVQQDKLDQWLTHFDASNIHPKILMPDVLALPYENGTWSILIKEDSSLIRTGLNNGFACDSCNLSVLINAALDSIKLNGTKLPSRLVIWDYTQDEHNENLLTLEHEIDIDYQSAEIDPINLMARGIRLNGKTSPALNLLQGEYSHQAEYGKMLLPWRATAILFAALLAIMFIGNLTELSRLESQEQALFSEMQNIYKRNFPDAKNISRPKLFMEQKLKALGVSNNGGGSKFFIFLTAISEMIPQHNATLKSISYNKQQLDVEVDIGSVQALDKLKAELTTKYNLSVDINTATPEDGKVNSRLRLKETSS